MLRFTRIVAVCFAASLFAGTLAAETTPAPPDWQDGRGASVYLDANGATHAAANVEAPSTGSDRYSAGPVAAPKFDSSVMPAVANEAVPAVDNASGRRLAPPSVRNQLPSEQRSNTAAGARRMLDFGIPTQSIYTVATALAIVIGAFLVFAWALRRGGKFSKNRLGMVPDDAVSVLGRVPLAARQFAELLRVGNKLVLVAMTPTGPATLTEVTDPIEVDRLVGLCRQFDPHSTTKAFEQVFQQLSSEPTAPGFLGDEPLPMSLSTAASAYRSHRGTARV